MSSADLDDYLGPDPKFFKAFAPFLRPISDPIKLGAITIARETYVMQPPDVEEWIAHMTAIGCERTPDERRRLKVPKSLDELFAELPNGSSPEVVTHAGE
jgi:hypothetical protein